jgi:hypothetical protein
MYQVVMFAPLKTAPEGLLALRRVCTNDPERLDLP